MLTDEPDPRVAALRARYVDGELSDDELDREIRVLAEERAAIAAAAAPLRPQEPPLARLVTALGAFCAVYLAYGSAPEPAPRSEEY